MSIIDRLGLLNDSLNLSGAGLQSFMTALQLLDSYRTEASMPVWGVIHSYMKTLRMFADDDKQLLKIHRSFVRDFAHTQYQRLGWEPIADESYFDELLRPMVIGLMAYAEDDDVVAKLCHMVHTAAKPSDIWGDIRHIALMAAAQHGGEPACNKLLHWYRTTSSAEERLQLINGLTTTHDLQLIQRGLDLLTGDEVKLQDLIYWVRGFINNRYARDATWQWMQDRWQWIIDHFGSDMHYTDFPKYAASAFSTPEQLASYRQFFSPMSSEPGISRTIAQGVEDIESRIAWRERDGQAVTSYLRTFVQK